MDPTQETFGQKLFGAVILTATMGVVGLVVALVIAGICDLATQVAYGKWIFWGGAIGAVIGLIIFGLSAFVEGEGDENDESWRDCDV